MDGIDMPQNDVFACKKNILALEVLLSEESRVDYFSSEPLMLGAVRAMGMRVSLHARKPSMIIDIDDVQMTMATFVDNIADLADLAVESCALEPLVDSFTNNEVIYLERRYPQTLLRKHSLSPSNERKSAVISKSYRMH